jgi:hypothetical protein
MILSALFFINNILGSMLYPEIVIIINVFLFALLLINAILLSYLEGKSQSSSVTKYRLEKIAFYANLRVRFASLGILSDIQLHECLVASNRELSELWTNRNVALTTISGVFSILISFTTVLTTKLTETATAQESLIYITVICFLFFAAFYFVNTLAKTLLLLFSSRERLLVAFAKDMSSFIILGMVNTSQQTNIESILRNSQEPDGSLLDNNCKLTSSSSSDDEESGLAIGPI